MQLPNHIAVSYVVYILSFGQTKYLVPFLIASVIVDIDHIIPWLRKGKNEKYSGALWRTRLHELYGLVILSMIIMALWFFNPLLAKVLFLGILMHYSIDFLAGETRPFYPYSDTKVQIFFKETFWKRVVIETVLMAVAIAYVLWIVLEN